MKSLVILGILMAVALVSGVVPIVEAHPHATIDLMESHSHDIHDDNFEENFILHSFEEVIISTFEFINKILFG